MGRKIASRRALAFCSGFCYAGADQPADTTVKPRLMAAQLEFDWVPGQGAAEARPPENQAPAPPRPAPSMHETECLRMALAKRSAMGVRLHITNNSSTMMSVKYNKAGDVATVRLHHMFLDAPKDIVLALARWVRNPRVKKSGQALNFFIRARNHQIKQAPRRPAFLQTSGRFFDLDALREEVNQKHFGGRIDAPITWGRMPKRRRRRSIRFGSWCPQENLVRIHPLLDQEFVPKFFVRYIVFHEMLHAQLGIEESASGRRVIHSREFNRLERAYPDFKRAVEWMDKAANLDRLLGGRRCA